MFPAPYPYLLLLVPAAVLARDDFRTRRVDASWLVVLGTVSVGVSWHTLAPTEFLWFLIAACVVALLWWVCCGRRRRTIPFVGAAGIVLIGWAALQFLRLWP